MLVSNSPFAYFQMVVAFAATACWIAAVYFAIRSEIAMFMALCITDIIMDVATSP
jgi:hypothetical protein